MSDWELLQAYTKNRSEAAFAELVRRHLNWVYSAAFRQTHDPHLAEDVAQAVFILLARKAGKLRAGTILSGWLFRTTRFVASRALRTEYRRKAREQTAVAMSSTTSSDENENLWSQLTPHLDQAVAALSETDRAAILLRFYEKKPLHEVGQQLGLSDDAAKKRVSRAVEKLRSSIARRGVVLGGAALAVALAEQAVQAAPANLAIGVMKAAAAGLSASATIPQLARETLHAWRLAKLKLVASIAAISVTGIVLTTHLPLWREPNAMLDSNKSSVAAIQAPDTVAQATQPTNNTPAAFAAASNRVVDVFVVEAKSKQPLAGVRIGASYQKAKITGKTDATGHYQVPLPEKDPLYLAVWAHQDGYVPLRTNWNTHKDADPVPNEFTFALEPAVSIGGIVQDEQGQPIASVSIGLSFNPPVLSENTLFIDSGGFKKTVTDGLGRWRFDQAPGNLRTMHIRLKHPDYGNRAYYPGSSDGSTPPDNKLRDMTATFVMKKGQSVTGVVLDQRGRAIAGALVGLGESMYNINFVKTTTDAMGAFRLNNAINNEMFLTVQADGYAPGIKNIEPGQDTSSIEFRLEPGHIIRGHVVDTQTNALAGVSIGTGFWHGHQLLAWQGTTDTNGLYEWTNAPADDVQLSFFKEGYQRLDRYELYPDAKNVVVTLKSPFIARGSVTDARTGEPISSFGITGGQLFDGSPEPSWNPQNHRNFSSGKYEYSVETEGRHVIRVEAEGYIPEISPPFDSKDGHLTYDFKLTNAPAIEGVVYSPDHRPLGGADVYLVASNHNIILDHGHVVTQTQNISVHTGEDGRFKFPPLRDRYTVVIVHEQGYALAVSQPNGALPDLIITPWARVEGDVFVGAQAAAARKVSVQLDRESMGQFKNEMPPVWLQANATTDNAGHFVADYIPADKVTVSLCIPLNERTHAFAFTHTLRIQPQPGQTVHVTIGGTGQAVIGRLLAPPGFAGPVDWSEYPPQVHTKIPRPNMPNRWLVMTTGERQAWIQAWLNSDEGRAYQQAGQVKPEIQYYAVLPGPDGSFRVEDVPSGQYQLDMTLDERRTNGTSVVSYPLAHVERDFTVPEFPSGRSDEPLDLGNLELRPFEQPK